ncbi:MAG: hypothetical protein ACM3ZC_11890 [Bacteroidota bacterium]
MGNLHAPSLPDNAFSESELLAHVRGLQPDDLAIGVLAHPFDPFHAWSMWGRELAGGMELMNGATDRGNPPRRKLMARWSWYLGRQLPAAVLGQPLAIGTAGSDGHREDIGIGLPVSYLPLPKGATEADVLGTLMKGRVIACTRQGLLADLMVNGVPAGGVLGQKAGEPLCLTARFV